MAGRLHKTDFSFVQVQPSWLPYNEEAKAIVTALLETHSLKGSAGLQHKYTLLVSSFLYAAQVSERHRALENSKPSYIGIRWRNEAWSHYPAVGKDIAKKVLHLLASSHCVKVEGSGDSRLWQSDEGKWYSDPIMSLYQLRDDVQLPNLSEARFINVARPLIKINKPETRAARDRRRKDEKPNAQIFKANAKKRFGNAYTATESRIRALNDFWLKHPLELPEGHAAASATRIYHDGSIERGGRLYGYWTNRKGELRRQSRIDGEPVCEVDIVASQPTLLNSLLGYRLQGLNETGTWQDAYAELSRLWTYGLAYQRHDPLWDQRAFIKRSRDIAKRVIMEIIGTGNADKSLMSDSLEEDLKVSKEEWHYFKEKLLSVVPGLRDLEPRFDSTGSTSLYINGPGFLSYHESEIILKAVETLMELDVPAYPVHDSLIVRLKDCNKAAEVLRTTIHDYCFKLTGLRVIVPLSFKTSEQEKSNLNKIKKNEYSVGQYL